MDVIEVDLLQERRDNRPRSNTWPLPEPPDFRAPPKPEPEPTNSEQEPLKQVASEPKKSSRKNAWGNYSYADLITQAIQSSPEKRLTLSQIYDWMVNSVPYFRDKGDSNSSAGWKNSIRHNLSLHSKFVRVQNEGNGKSSWWVLNPDAKGAKTSRRRSGSLDSAQKSTEKRRGRSKKDKIKEESDRPGSPRLNVGRLNRSGSPGNISPTSSSSDSLLTVPELVESDSPLPFPLNDSFGRPRTSSNASTVSSIGGRLSPIPAHDDEDYEFDATVSPSVAPNMPSNPAAEELTELADGMTLETSYSLENHPLKRSLSPGNNLLHQPGRTPPVEMNISNPRSTNLTNGFDSSFDSGFFQPARTQTQSSITQEMSPMPVSHPTSYSTMRVNRSLQFQNNYPQHQPLAGQNNHSLLAFPTNGHRDTEMEIQTSSNQQINLYDSYNPNFNTCNTTTNPNQNHINNIANSYGNFMQQMTTNNSAFNSLQNLNQQLGPGQRNMQNQLEFMNEKFPSDLELDCFEGELECDMDTIISSELNMGDGGFDFNFEQLVASAPNNPPVTVGEFSAKLY